MVAIIAEMLLLIKSIDCLMGSNNILFSYVRVSYKANNIDVSITNIPIPAPKYVGQSVPEFGRVGAAVGVAAAAATTLH